MSEKHSLISSQDSEAKTEPAHTNQCESDEKEVKVDDSNQATNLGQRFTDSFILLCCEDVLQLYSFKSVLQVPSCLILIHFSSCLITFATKVGFFILG